MRTVHVSRAAESDLFTLLAHISNSSPDAAAHVESHLSAAIDSLEEFANRGAVASESVEWGYTVRTLLVFSYRILYTVHEKDVVVLRIMHGSQLTPPPPTE